VFLQGKAGCKKAFGLEKTVPEQFFFKMVNNQVVLKTVWKKTIQRVTRWFNGDSPRF
jgi:hypothetical protein